MKVPFSDIAFDQEEIDAVSEVLKSGWPSRGKVSAEFESALGKYLGSNVALVNSGSSALLCALLAHGIRATDIVLVPDFTFIATASIPAILGCRIHPMDCDLETFLVDGDLAVKNGIPIPLGREAIGILTDIAGLPIKPNSNYGMIEDAAEALGAETRNGKVGSGDHLTCFSFNATKSLSTVEGGAVASKNEELIEKVRSISNYGRTKEQYIHDRLGLNCRITDMQSALGLIQLRKLDRNLARRREIADRYRKELPQFRFQKVPSYVTRGTNYWMIGLSDKQDFYLGHFQRAGIDARRVFLPIHMQPCFEGLPKCPNAEKIYEQALALPIYSSISDEAVDYLIDVANRHSKE